MDSDLAVLIAWSAVSVTANVFLAVAWFRASRRAARLEQERQLSLNTPRPEGRGDRTDRLEQAVDSLAAQVDQLASGQEFLNRVLADRLDKLGKALPDRVREVTPH